MCCYSKLVGVIQIFHLKKKRHENLKLCMKEGRGRALQTRGQSYKSRRVAEMTTLNLYQLGPEMVRLFAH